MRGLRFLALTLACVLPVTPALAGSATAKKPDVARNQALIAFQRDLISVLAPRADALPLLGAALLARPLPNQPKYNDFHTLIERASQADDTGPEVSWVRLSDCDAQADTCPSEAAQAKLVEQAPDNAAVWLLKLGQDVRNEKKKDAREDLAKAASAKLYDDYTGASLKALANAVVALPPPADIVDPASSAGASGVQALIVYSVAGTLPQAGLQATAKLCESDSDDPTLKDDCLKLGKTLEWGASPLARSLGLHLREVLSSDAEQQEDAKRARRSLIWQVQNFAQLSGRASSDKAIAQHLLALARSGGTEMSMLLAALRDYSISVDPPTDWQPQGK
ncbi:hypothetical protein [Dyella tabacisoli]|nr:hypothetical protein [Dyella tabacisoli]